MQYEEFSTLCLAISPVDKQTSPKDIIVKPWSTKFSIPYMILNHIQTLFSSTFNVPVPESEFIKSLIQEESFVFQSAIQKFKY